MEFDVLPGPSLPELARTALVRAAHATVSARAATSLTPAGQVPVRALRDGNPVLLLAVGSLLEQQLSARPNIVTVTVPARIPFRVLRLSGTTRTVAHNAAAQITACAVDLRSVEFTGLRPAPIPVSDYRTAAPDPLWQVAPGILRHLEHGHMGELVRCVRAHGMTDADSVIPRSLDRYGLELVVLTAVGAAVVRLSFPDGPVTSLQDVPASIRITLTCRCQAGPGHRRFPA
jgi:hypothetical protein